MNKKKLNNNGFSLVELIIVIAIMAVLVGVLAPQFIGYVEKSKKSNDVSTIDSIANALDALAIDPSVNWEKNKKIVFEVKSSGNIVTTGSDVDSAVLTEFGNVIPQDTTLKGAWTGSSIKFTATFDGSKVNYTSENTGATEIMGYSSSLAARLE